MADIEQNKAVVRRYVDEVWNKGRMELIDTLYWPDFAYHVPVPGMPPGLAGLKMAIQVYRTAFPNLKMTVELLVAEGDLVANHWRLVGLNSGQFMGMPPTGKPVDYVGTTIFRLKDGKIIEDWGVIDATTMMVQMGLMPSPAG